MNTTGKIIWRKVVVILGTLLALIVLISSARLLFLYSAGQKMISAANHGDLPEMKHLVAVGADVNDGDSDLGATALSLASDEGHTDIVQYLLSKGANVNAVDNDGKTALIMAASNGHTDVMKLLLNRGVNVNAQDHSGRTALMEAVYNGRTEAVQLLLDYRADVNVRDNKGETALGIAKYFIDSRSVGIAAMLKQNHAEE